MGLSIDKSSLCSIEFFTIGIEWEGSEKTFGLWLHRMAGF